MIWIYTVHRASKKGHIGISQSRTEYQQADQSSAVSYVYSVKICLLIRLLMNVYTVKPVLQEDQNKFPRPIIP